MKKPFDRELYLPFYRDLLKYTGDQLEEAIAKHEYQNRNLKEGENVLSVYYYNSVLPNEEVESFEKELNAQGLELSFRDETGQIKASVFEYITHIYIGVKVTEAIIQGASYDLVKLFFKKAAIAANKKFSGVFTGSEYTKRVTTLEFQSKTKDEENKVVINFNISPEIDVKFLEKSIDNILPILLKAVREITSYQESRYLNVQFTLSENGEWEIEMIQSPPIAKTNKEPKKGKKKKKKH